MADISRQGNLLTQILRIQQTYLVTGTGEGPGGQNACSLGTAGFQKEGTEGAELIYRFSFWTHHSDEILCLLWDRVCGGGEDQEWSSGGERSSPPFQHIQVEMAQKYWVCLPGSARPIIHHLWHTTSISVKWNKNLKTFVKQFEYEIFLNMLLSFFSAISVIFRKEFRCCTSIINRWGAKLARESLRTQFALEPDCQAPKLLYS